MKLSLNQSGNDRIEWFDAEVEGELHRLTDLIGNQDSLVEIILVNSDYIQKINKRYRDEDRPTDVISFSYADDKEFPSEDNSIGELYISFEYVEKEANLQGVNPRHLLMRVTLHGLLHVTGYGHETDSEERKMEDEEKRILGQLLEPGVVETLFL